MDSSYSSLGTKSGDIDDEIGHYDAPAGSSIGRCKFKIQFQWKLK
jgi:hypothetical protein